MLVDPFDVYNIEIPVFIHVDVLPDVVIGLLKAPTSSSIICANMEILFSPPLLHSLWCFRKWSCKFCHGALYVSIKVGLVYVSVVLFTVI